MSELLWTRTEENMLSCESNGLKLLISPVVTGGGFRYQLLLPSPVAAVRVCMASGYRDKLNEAITAAERAAKQY